MLEYGWRQMMWVPEWLLVVVHVSKPENFRHSGISLQIKYMYATMMKNFYCIFKPCIDLTNISDRVISDRVISANVTPFPYW